MAQNDKKLPKATAEIVKEYKELDDKLSGLDPSWSNEEVNSITQRMNELEEQYDLGEVL